MRAVANLAEVGRGERFMVRRILFDGPRVRCGAEGLRAGDRGELVERGRGVVLMRVGNELVRCPLDVACYVEVVRERGRVMLPSEGVVVG